MGPMLPYTRSEPKVVRIYNDSSVPVEVMALDYDEELKEECKILRGIEGYENDVVFLEPRSNM